jgi:DNA-binding MarR family transcriptional regulator
MFNDLTALGNGIRIYSIILGGNGSISINKKSKDKLILNLLNRNKKFGVTDLCKIVKIYPKNLLIKIKEFEKDDLILKKTIPAKPKGRKRIYYLSKNGEKILESINSIRLDT